MAARKSILLVEDEVLLCWVLEEGLVEGGYDVSIATTGNEGLAALEKDHGYQALVTNIRLVDGPDGWELARHARELNPSIGVVYVSGDSAADYRASGVPGSVMLAKPFEPEQLLEAVASTLKAE